MKLLCNGVETPFSSVYVCPGHPGALIQTVIYDFAKDGEYKMVFENGEVEPLFLWACHFFGYGTFLLALEARSTDHFPEYAELAITSNGITVKRV